MKTRSLCAASLTALVALSLVGGSNASATSGNVGGDLDSKGKVTVTAGEAGGGEDTKDPEDPDKEVDPDNPDITVNPNKGSLIIQAVSNPNFGTVSKQTTAITKAAAAVPLTQKDSGDEVEAGHYVQWSDLREDKDYGYVLSAKMSEQFKNAAGGQLTGSTISYTNTIINSAVSDTAIWPSIGTDGANFTLTESGNSAQVAVASGAGNGKGEFFVEFGQSSRFVANALYTGTPGTEASSVNLHIPANTASSMATTDYTATITWTLTAA